MECPRTGTVLKPVTINDIEIDLSTGCGGVWFDNHELDKFDEIYEQAGSLLVEHMLAYHKPLSDPDARLRCPKDTDVVMMRRFYSPKHQIEIDECPQCGGVWLDAEELAGIRELFPTQDHRNEVGNEFVKTVMNSTEVTAYEHEANQLPDKLNKITNVLWSILLLGGDR